MAHICSQAMSIFSLAPWRAKPSSSPTAQSSYWTGFWLSSDDPKYLFGSTRVLLLFCGIFYFARVSSVGWSFDYVQFNLSSPRGISMHGRVGPCDESWTTRRWQLSKSSDTREHIKWQVFDKRKCKACGLAASWHSSFYDISHTVSRPHLHSSFECF